MWVGDH